MENKAGREERLLAFCNSIRANYPNMLKALQAGHSNERFMSLALSGHYQSFAIKSFFIDQNIARAKKYFYNSGLLDVLLTTKYDEKILDAGLGLLSYALLSDDQNLIREYADLRHSKYEEMFQNGRSTPIFALQCLIREDWKEFERAMPIVKNKSVPKLKMGLDAEFYMALAEKNKVKMEQVLEELVSPKVHKQRNEHYVVINEFISHPALGSAKLAWIKGIEVEVNSPLIPRELLPVMPLPVYEKIAWSDLPGLA